MCTEASLEQDILALAMAPRAERKKLAVQILNLTWEKGLYPASIAPVYQALGSGKLAAMTIPAFNVRGLTYPLARAIWRAAMEAKSGPIIFELAPSESSGCDQTFEEYAAMVMAAAFKEGYRGPVFLQGDHFSLENAEDLSNLEKLAVQVIESGFYQIDIDGSHLFDENASELTGFHQPNAQGTAQLIKSIRSQQPHDIHITLGGEVGEIGGRNTSLADLEAFHAELKEQLSDDTPGLDKISAQTGTTHSGIVLPDGSTGRMSVDFELIAALSEQARQFGWSGMVQHGASTLHFEDLAKLPKAGVIEVHLATQIQNILFDHPAFPADLLAQMKRELVSTTQAAEGDQLDVRADLSPAQRFYQARWAAWGIYKTQLWQLPDEVIAPVSESLAEWATQIFKALKVNKRRKVLKDFYPEEA